MNDGTGSTVFCLRDTCRWVVFINYSSWEGISVFEKQSFYVPKKVTGNDTVNLRLHWGVERAYACLTLRDFITSTNYFPLTDVPSDLEKFCKITHFFSLCIFFALWNCFTIYLNLPLGGENFRTSPDQPRGSPNLLHGGYRISVSGVKRPRSDDHQPT